MRLTKVLSKFLSMVLLTLVVGQFAFAAEVTDFSCSVKEDGQVVSVQFRIKNLEKGKRARLEAYPGTDDETGPILVNPDMIGEHYSDLVNLNAQGGDLRMEDDRLILFGDGDGYTLVDLVLFKDTGYTQGYVRVYGSGNKWYQKTTCRVR